VCRVMGKAEMACMVFLGKKKEVGAGGNAIKR
jgi:hypothetical protein